MIFNVCRPQCFISHTTSQRSPVMRHRLSCDKVHLQSTLVTWPWDACGKTKHSFQTKFDVKKIQILDQSAMLVPFRPWFCHFWPVDQLTGRWPLKLALVNRIKMGFNFFEWLTKTRPTYIQEMLQTVDLPKLFLSPAYDKSYHSPLFFDLPLVLENLAVFEKGTLEI